MSTYKEIAALKKAGEILSALADSREPLSAGDIAKRADMPQGTALCHLETMIGMGWVEKVGGCYKIGMGISLIHARHKSRLLGERAEIDRKLEKIS